LFYPPLDSETPHQRHAREMAAKAVCGGCPVRVECLAWALASDEQLGVWGGMSERERQLLSGHRRRRTPSRVAAG
jgi:WhiB family transcriptional regulator, redox-sensing transcriptional regulator